MGLPLFPVANWAPWLPTSIVGLQTWFQANALSLANDDPVGTWTDSSGNGKDATQATSDNKPVFKTGVINTLPVVRFDGTNDRLVTASITHGVGTGDMFYASVVKTATVGGATGYKCMQDLGTDSPAFFINNAKLDYYLAGDKQFATTLTSTTWYTFIVRRFGGTLEAYINGTLDATTFSNSANIASAALTLGSEGGGGQYFNSDMAEILFGKTLSNNDRDSLTTYLRAKYGHY